MRIFDFIKADQFFPKYCPEIKSYYHKIRGKNGRGNPVEFSEAEKKAIKAALKQLAKDCQFSFFKINCGWRNKTRHSIVGR